MSWLGWAGLARGGLEHGLTLDSGLAAFPSRARSSTLPPATLIGVADSRGPRARIFDRRMHEDSGGWRSGLASRGPLASSLGIGCPHELARCFSTPFVVRRRKSSAAGAATEWQRSLQGAELAPQREAQAGSEVGGRCRATRTPTHPPTASSRLVAEDRRCPPPRPSADNLRARAAGALATTAAAMQPPLAVLCGGAAGFDRTSSSTVAVARDAAASSVKLQAGGCAGA
jgi:hypothetical protein